MVNNKIEKNINDSDFYLDEACYYLKKSGQSFNNIAKKFEENISVVKKRFQNHEKKIQNSQVEINDYDLSFWLDVENEIKGDDKVTFIRDKSFYHCRKSDLVSFDSETLLNIFNQCKDFLFLDLNYNYGFIKKNAPVGYDPFILIREIKKVVKIIEEILTNRE